MACAGFFQGGGGFKDVSRIFPAGGGGLVIMVIVYIYFYFFVGGGVRENFVGSCNNNGRLPEPILRVGSSSWK